MKKKLLSLLFSSSAICMMTACETVETKPDYSSFLLTNKAHYPATMEVYMNRELIAEAKPDSPIHICLEQQRGRLYVNGEVAADWPVSTGKEGSETPTGTFKVLEKKKKHFSSVWGTIVDENDICVVATANSRKDKVPKGCEFLGAKMEYWMRLTDEGVGIHTGFIRCGMALSQGCVRTPAFIAEELYDIAELGTKVYISQKPESEWPGNTQQKQQLPAEQKQTL